jgi:hypothetical protein
LKNNKKDNSGFIRYLLIDIINARIRSALLSTDATRDIQILGISITKTRYVIRFKN